MPDRADGAQTSIVSVVAVADGRRYRRESHSPGAPLPSSDLRDQLQATLTGSYTIERELGGGGMARVFVAEETALGRRVVIQVLPPETAAQVSLERFTREILLAARLQHPHIVPFLASPTLHSADANGRACPM